MLKDSTSSVLVAFRGAAYRSVRHASSLAAALLGTRRISAHRGWGGEKSGLFEHPAWWTSVDLDVQTDQVQAC